MHVAMVCMDGHKMSKSRGNLVFVDALRRLWDPRVIRLGIVAHHYRSEWEWNEGIMPAGAERLARWESSSSTRGETDAGMLDAVRACFDDDLATPAALNVIDEAARSGHDVTAAAALLGVRLS
jgi:L-cysteine:1D-myo-inositol 2-amino-2-deoxy-alpha-D-glucopyranoside ligase